MKKAKKKYDSFSAMIERKGRNRTRSSNYERDCWEATCDEAARFMDRLIGFLPGESSINPKSGFYRPDHHEMYLRLLEGINKRILKRFKETGDVSRLLRSRGRAVARVMKTMGRLRSAAGYMNWSYNEERVAEARKIIAMGTLLQEKSLHRWYMHDDALSEASHQWEAYSSVLQGAERDQLWRVLSAHMLPRERRRYASR